MFDLLKIRRRHGRPFVPDLRKAAVAGPFRGRPELSADKCTRCGRCEAVCPSATVTAEPLRIDLGRCVFCDDCEEACSDGRSFSPTPATICTKSALRASRRTATTASRSSRAACCTA